MQRHQSTASPPPQFNASAQRGTGNTNSVDSSKSYVGRSRGFNEPRNTTANTTRKKNVLRDDIGGTKKRKNINTVINTDGVKTITTGAGDATDPTTVNDFDEFFGGSELGSYESNQNAKT